MILTVVLLAALIVTFVYAINGIEESGIYWPIAIFIALILESINLGVHLADRNTIHSAAADGEYYLTVTLQEDPENVNFEDYQLSEKAPKTKDK